VLGDVVVGTEPQAGHDVDLGIARRQDQDRQAGSAAAQPATEFEAALGLVAEPDVDDGEVRQAAVEPLLRGLPIGVGGDLETMARQGVAQVVADGRFVFDDGDASGHDAPRVPHGRPALADERQAAISCLPVATFDHSAARDRPARALHAESNALMGKARRIRGNEMRAVDRQDTTGTAGAMAGDLFGAGEGEARMRHPGAWLEWLMLIGYAAATAIAIGCALGIVVALTASAAMAAPAAPDTEATRSLGQSLGAQILPAALAGLPRVAGVDEADGAGLLLDTPQGLVVAPVQATSAKMKVTGSTVRG